MVEERARRRRLRVGEEPARLSIRVAVTGGPDGEEACGGFEVGSGTVRIRGARAVASESHQYRRRWGRRGGEARESRRLR